MPSAVRFSLWLYIGGFIAGVIVSAVWQQGWVVISEVPDSALILLAVVVCAWAFVVWRAYGRRNWARWVLVVSVLVAVPGAVQRLETQFSLAPLLASISTFIYSLKVASVVLLFLPASTAWYKRTIEATITS